MGELLNGEGLIEFGVVGYADIVIEHAVPLHPPLLLSLLVTHDLLSLGSGGQSMTSSSARSMGGSGGDREGSSGWKGRREGGGEG